MRALVLTLAVLAGCAPFLSVGVDHSTQANSKPVGYHVAFGLGASYEPRQKQAVSVLASRRVTAAGAVGYASDGWELRGDLDLPQPNYRVTAALRRAGVYDVDVDDRTGMYDDARVWGGFVGLTRYWPNMWQVLSVSVGPSFEHAALPGSEGWAIGGELRVQWMFDGTVQMIRICNRHGVCGDELGHMVPRGYVEGNYSWFGSVPHTDVCSQQGGTDQYGVARATWKCY